MVPFHSFLTRTKARNLPLSLSFPTASVFLFGIIVFFAYGANFPFWSTNDAAQLDIPYVSVICTIFSVTELVVILVELVAWFLIDKGIQNGDSSGTRSTTTRRVFQTKKRKQFAFRRCIKRSLRSCDYNEIPSPDDTTATNESKMQQKQQQEPLCCSICLEEFKSEDDIVATVNDCCRSNLFHDHCIKQWLESDHDSCPCCRQPILEDPNDEHIDETEEEEAYREHTTEEYRGRMQSATRRRNEIIAAYLERERITGGTTELTDRTYNGNGLAHSTLLASEE